MDPFPGDLASLALELKGCACSALVGHGLVGPECCDPGAEEARAFVANGLVAWDACCIECGQLSVRLVRVYESERPPQQAVGPSPCWDRRLVAEWEVLWIRCVSVTDEDEGGLAAVPPPAGVIEAEGLELLRAVRVLHSAVLCCVAGWRDDPMDDRDGWVTQAALVGPEGGCAGVQVVVSTIVGDACDCSGPPQPPVV